MLAATQRLLPNAPVVYAADSAGYPYGTKSEAEIAARVPALLGRLVERYRPRLVVIACNTASTIALAHVREALDVPIVGTVPAIKPAALLSKTRAIGVLGTEATIRQPYVDRLAAEFAGDCLVLRHGSAELVDLAEAKLRGEPTDPDAYAADPRRPARPAGRRAHRHRRSRLHAFPPGRARAAAPRGRCALRRRRRGDRAPHRPSDGRPDWPAAPAGGTAVFTRSMPASRPFAPPLPALD